MSKENETAEEIVRDSVTGLRQIAEKASGADDHATARACHAEIIKAAYWLRDRDK